MQQNLEQIRAKYALNFWKNRNNDSDIEGDQGGDVVRGLASLVINNGLLATIAFANEKKKGYKTFMEEIGKFLSSNEHKILPSQVTNLESFVKVLTDNDSSMLQQATSESIAYLAYLKRFRVKKEK